MSKQSGKRSQNDPNAGPNANDTTSKQSSEEAQHTGSTDHDRSVRSALSGQASQPHAVTDGSMTERLPDDLESGTGLTAPTDKGNTRRNKND